MCGFRFRQNENHINSRVSEPRKVCLNSVFEDQNLAHRLRLGFKLSKAFGNLGLIAEKVRSRIFLVE